MHKRESKLKIWSVYYPVVTRERRTKLGGMRFILCLIASLSLMVLGVVGGLPVDERLVDCPAVNNFSPCNCTQNNGSFEGAPKFKVSCDQIPIAEIQALFNQTSTHNLSSLELIIAPSETLSIPADLLGTSRTKSLTIICKDMSYNLIIHDDAFRSSKDFTKVLTIDGCDLNQQPNFGFLDGFKVLASLSISNSKNFNSFQGLPSQSKLYYISILNCRGFGNLEDSTKIALPSLRQLYLDNNKFDDRVVAKVLKILTQSSTESLEELGLDANKLTRVPELITSFSNLHYLMMEHNAIHLLHSQSLVLTGRMDFLNLAYNGISTIEPSAFVGQSYRRVYFTGNKLTRFDSYNFQTMLEGMDKASYGGLSLADNPIECDCHLAWLIVHNRNLLPIISVGLCSNSTSFYDLNPEGFRDCPVFTCPTGFDGKFRNPLTCSSYYTCLGGISTLVECDEGLVFNSSNQKCESLENVPTCNNIEM